MDYINFEHKSDPNRDFEDTKKYKTRNSLIESADQACLEDESCI